MVKKTLCFSNRTRLSLRLGQLVIQLAGSEGEVTTVTRPIEDIGVIILESHDITLTSALMAYLAKSNVAVMICDEKHIPRG